MNPGYGSPDDSTAVVRMMGEFQEYVNKDIEKRRMEQKMVREKETEVLVARSKMASLQGRLQEMETVNLKDKAEFERELQNFKLERQKDRDHVRAMKQKLEFMSREESRAKADAEECKKSIEKEKLHQREKIQELKQEILKLNSQLHEAQNTGRSECSVLRNELIKKDGEITQLKLDLEENRIKLQHSMRRAVEVSGLRSQVQQFRDQAMDAEKIARGLELKLQKYEETAIVGNVMKDQLSKLSEIERENKKLKEENEYFRESKENYALLQERCNSLETKLSRSDSRIIQTTKLQIENEELQEKLKRWETMDAGGTIKARSPQELTRQVAELQQKEALLLAQQGQASTSAHSFEQAYKSVSVQLSESNQQLHQVTHKMKQTDDLVKRLQRRLLLVTKERDGLRQVLNDYDSEVTPAGNESHYKLRMEQAEEALHTAGRHIDKLEIEIKDVTEEGGAARLAAAKLKLEVAQLKQQLEIVAANTTISAVNPTEYNELKDRLAQMEKENLSLAERNETLEAIFEQRDMQGEFDPTKTKVLHFGMNPGAIARQRRAEEMGKLKEECEILRNRVKELEEGGANVSGEKLSQKFGETTTKDFEDLKKELKSSELRNQRLKEVFYKKIQEYREACYRLTGYKIDNPKDNHYMLMSMYADSQDDVLMFRSTDCGEIQLLESQFSSTLTDLVEQFLINQDSIPMFLSSVTSELFGRQTMVTS